MALEAVKQVSSYNATTQAAASAPSTQVVNGVTPKAATTQAKDDFSMDDTAASYGSTNMAMKSERDANSNNTDALKQAVEKINKKMSNSVAQYGIHEATKRVTIKIVDKDTKEVIREFPPEETLDMIAKAWELAGLMVDEKR